MKNPFFSVVMPAYNASKYIKESIQSILDQSFDDWELVVVDDCSTDSTNEVVRRLMEKAGRIKLHRLPHNSGAAYIPRKEAILRSTGDYIVLLDADDFLEKDYLKKINARILQTNADILLGRMCVFVKYGVFKSYVPKPDFDMSQVIIGKQACMLTIDGWKIGFNGSSVRTSVFEDAFTKYDESFINMYADEMLTRKLLLCAEKVAFADASYYYRLNEESITNKFHVKLFDTLINNQKIKEIIISEFGENSPESAQMDRHIYHTAYQMILFYYTNRKCISDDQRKTILNKLYVAWNSFDRKNILNLGRRATFIKHLNVKGVLLAAHVYYMLKPILRK